jgi:integrase
MNDAVQWVDGITAKDRRARGEGRVYQRGRFWWIQYYRNGRRMFESSRSERKEAAERLLRRRLAEVAAGIMNPAVAARCSYETLRDALLADYTTNRRKWLRVGKNGKPYVCGISTLNRFFKHFRASDITTDSLRQFIRERQDTGAANGTINRSLALLRRMLRLAVQDGKLRDVPHFPMLKEAAPRRGFLDHEAYQRLRQEIPEHLRPILAMGYYTGMRLGEILRLKWPNVDLKNAEILLDSGLTKNDESRTIPIVAELLEMLRIEHSRNQDSQFVFVHDGKRIASFRKAWKSAVNRADLPGLLFHDLRRTGIRNLVRAGVPERVAMAISGHKTRTVFERYNIVSGRDLRDAALKLETYLSRENGDKSATHSATARGTSSAVRLN